MKTISDIFIAFFKYKWNFAHLKKRISLMAQIFCKLVTPKNVLSWMPSSFCFRAPLKSERVHGSQTLLKSAWENFYCNFPVFQDKLSGKISFWIRSKMLRLFVKTLMCYHMYSPHSWEKFLQRVQAQLYEKRKKSSESFIEFLKSTWNFAQIENKRSTW